MIDTVPIWKPTLKKIADKADKIKKFENTNSNMGSIAKAKAMQAIVDNNPKAANKIILRSGINGDFSPAMELFTATSPDFAKALDRLKKMDPSKIRIETKEKHSSPELRRKIIEEASNEIKPSPIKAPGSSGAILSDGSDFNFINNLTDASTLPDVEDSGLPKPLIIGGILLALAVVAVVLKKLKKK